MSFADYSVFVDFAFIILLVAVLVYAIRLNRHISVLRNNKHELEKMLASFVASTERAEDAIQKVKANTQQNIKAVQDSIDKAETLRADLSYMLDRGEEIANRLESGIRSGRTTYQANAGDPEMTAGNTGNAEVPPATRAEQPQTNEVKSKSKADLLKALQGMR